MAAASCLDGAKIKQGQSIKFVPILKGHFLYSISYVIISAASFSLLHWLFLNTNVAKSFAAGALISFVLLQLSSIALIPVFIKKFVALSILVIVIKYLILWFMLSKLIQESWVITPWFCLGLLCFIPAALLVGQRVLARENSET